MLECGRCGRALPEGTRYCPECGSPVDAAAAGGSPFAVERFWPPEPLVAAAVLLALVGLALLVVGTAAWGVAALLAAVVAALARGRVDAREAAVRLSHLRVRAAATGEAVAARSRGQVDLFRARRERAELEADRNRLFRELGLAVYADDETGMRAARNAIDAVSVRIADKEAEIDTLIRETEERVQRAQAQARPTERLETPPEPARVPEPWPPPDEGDLPGPPTPSPGEPVPGPEEPAPPSLPPMPQTRHDDPK